MRICDQFTFWSPSILPSSMYSIFIGSLYCSEAQKAVEKKKRVLISIDTVFLTIRCNSLILSKYCCIKENDSVEDYDTLFN